MNLNKTKKMKLNFTLLILTFSIVISCSNKSIYLETPEAKRFEEMLQKTNNIINDTVIYVYWNDHSCGACRKYSQNSVAQNQQQMNKIRFIVPKLFKKEAELTPDSLLIIDNSGVFTEKYIGIDNVGLIKTFNGKVISIKNYSAQEIDQFDAGLLK